MTITYSWTWLVPFIQELHWLLTLSVYLALKRNVPFWERDIYIYIYMATYTLRIFQSKSTYKNGSVNKTWYEYSQSFMIRLTQFHTYIYCPNTALCLKYSRYSLKHLSINYCLKMLPRKQRQRREDVVLSLGRLLMILINESTRKFMFQCKHLVSIHT